VPLPQQATELGRKTVCWRALQSVALTTAERSERCEQSAEMSEKMMIGRLPKQGSPVQVLYFAAWLLIVAQANVVHGQQNSTFLVHRCSNTMGQLWDRIKRTADAHTNPTLRDDLNPLHLHQARQHVERHRDSDEERLAREIANAAQTATAADHQTTDGTDGTDGNTPRSNTHPPQAPEPKPLDPRELAALQELGLAVYASDEDIRRAFKAQMMRYHPDVTAGLSAETQFAAADKAQRLNQAYQMLKTLRSF